MTFGMEVRCLSDSENAAVAQANSARLAMARLIAVAGHDLKQPLQVAVTSIARAANETIPPGAAARLTIAMDALARLGLELDDLARCSQVDTGSMPRIAAFHLHELLEFVEKDWRKYVDTIGVDLAVVTPAVQVESDPAMVRTILRNLIGNAIKYSGPGGRVVVACRRRGDHVLVEVHDNGVGIPGERLAQIFEPFEQGRHEGPVAGLGLGLHIVRQTAELLGHPVTVRSIEGRGSSFTLQLPVAGPS